MAPVAAGAAVVLDVVVYWQVQLAVSAVDGNLAADRYTFKPLWRWAVAAVWVLSSTLDLSLHQPDNLLGVLPMIGIAAHCAVTGWCAYRAKRVYQLARERDVVGRERDKLRKAMKGEPQDSRRADER